jgi:hypothetical protein
MEKRWRSIQNNTMSILCEPTWKQSLADVGYQSFASVCDVPCPVKTCTAEFAAMPRFLFLLHIYDVHTFEPLFLGEAFVMQRIGAISERNMSLR